MGHLNTAVFEEDGRYVIRNKQTGELLGGPYRSKDQAVTVSRQMSAELPDITFDEPPAPTGTRPLVRGVPGVPTRPGQRAAPAVLDITFEPTPQEAERQRRLARIEAQFTGVPTPGEAFRTEFARGFAGQRRRTGAALQRYLAAAGERIAAGAEQIVRSGPSSRFLALPPTMGQIRGAGQVALGGLQAAAAPATALGDVVIPDTMDLLVEAGAPQPVLIAYGTIAQTALDFTADPTWALILGRAIPKAAVRAASRGARLTRAQMTQMFRRAVADEIDDLGFHNLPVVRTQRGQLDRAIREADAAIARRERVPRVPPAAARPVLLERPPIPETRIGPLGLEQRPAVTPVTQVAPREVIPTPTQRARTAAEAAAAATEAAETRVGQLPRAAGGVVLQPRPVPGGIEIPVRPPAGAGRIVPVTEAPRRVPSKPGLPPEELDELTRYGWTRQQIGQMSPQRARVALEEGRALAEREARVAASRQARTQAAPPLAQIESEFMQHVGGPEGVDLLARARQQFPEQHFAQPAVPPAAATAPPAPRLQIGDEVVHAQDGNTYRVERVGPRGVGLVDVQTGARRISVPHADVPQLLRPVPRGVPAAGRLLPTEPVAPELRLAGQEAQLPPVEIGRQQQLGAAVPPQKEAESGAAAAAAAARVRARKPETELTIGEFVRGQGGISIQKSPDLAGELRDLQRQKITPPGLITTKAPRSVGADTVAKTLTELGFRKPDGSEITGADLPRLLEDEYGGRVSKEQFLHPASTRRAGMQETEIVDQQLRAELQARGILTRRLEEYFDLPRPVKAAAVRALRMAEEQFGRAPKGDKELTDFGALAARIYNTEMRPKLSKADQAEVLSPKFFHEFYVARDVDPGDVALDVVRNEDGGMDLAERLDEANTYIDEAAEALKRKKPKLDEAGALRLHLLGELWDTAVQPTRDLREILREIPRGALRQSDGVVTRMGPEGRALVAAKNGVQDDLRLALGKRIVGPLEGIRIKYIRAHGAQAWNELGEKFRVHREGVVAVQLTPEEQAIYDVVDTYLGKKPTEGVVARAREQGLIVGFIGKDTPLEGGLGLTEAGEVGYWPIRLDWDVAERRQSDAIAAIMERTGADFERAQRILFNLLRRQRTGRPFGNLERTRAEWAPYFVRKSAWQELNEYAFGAERRIAEARHYGPNDEVFNEALAAIRSARPAAPGRIPDADFVEAWFEANTRRAPREIYAEAVARKVGDLQVASKMVLSVIANSTQPMNNLLVTNTSTFLRTLLEVTNRMTREEALEFARSTGAAVETHMRQLLYELGAAEAGTKVVTKTGFLTVEGGNRLFTAVLGRNWARDLTKMLRRAKPGTRRERFIIRHLEQIGLDPAQIRKQGFTLTGDQERLAGLKLSDITQFPINPGTLPLWWSSPWWRLATQFKTFAYKQGGLLYDAVIGEARRGNLKPLVVFLTVFPLVGEAVADVRLLLRRLPRTITEGPGAVLRERPQTFGARYLSNMAYVGGVGLMSDFLRALERRLPQEAIASFLGGPTFGSEAMQALLGGAAALRGDIGDAARRWARQLVGLTVTPGLTAAVGLPGALAGEGFESLFITRRALPRHRRGRRRRRTR